MLRSQLKLAVVGLIVLLGAATAQPEKHAKTGVDAHGDPLPIGAVARLGTVRFRHGSMVEQVVLPPDAKNVVSMSRWEGVRVWDAAGREFRRYPEKVGPVMNRFAAALSPDGRFVVMVDGLGGLGLTLGLHDVMTGQQVRTIGEAGEFRNPTGVLFSPDGKLAAVVERSNLNEPTIGIWEVESGQLRHAMKGHKEPVTSLLFTKNGKTLITGGGPDGVEDPGAGRIILWDVATGKQRLELAAQPGNVSRLAVSADGRRLASLNMVWVKTGPRSAAGCYENRIRIWDLDAGKELRQLVVDSKENQFGRPQGFGGLFFTPDGKTLLTTGPDHLWRIWEPDSGKQLRQMAGKVWPMVFSSDGKTLVGTRGGVIQLIDWATGKELIPESGPQGIVASAALLADGQTAVTVGGDASIFVWDFRTGRQKQRLAGHEGGVTLVPSRDGGTLFSVGDGTVRVWDVVGGKELRKWPIELDDPFRAVIPSLSADGKILALANGRHVRLFDTDTGRQRGDLKHPNRVVSLAFTPDATLTAATADHAVHVWDVATLRELELFDLPLLQTTRHIPRHTLEERKSWDCMAVTSPNGKVMAYSCFNGLAFVDLAATQLLKGSVQELAGWPQSFSPDGRMLAISHWPDGTIRLIETATGKERRRLSGHEGPANTVTFSHDGKLLLSVSQDATALIWDLTRPDGEDAGGPMPEDIQTCWTELADADAKSAYQAILRLARAADAAVPYLADRLQPIMAVDEKQLARLINELGSDRFAVREAASKELDRLGETAAAASRKALDQGPSAEMRRRLEELLDRYEHPAITTSKERLRTLRALEVLELAGTSPARQVLVKLSSGAKSAWLTEEALSALKRLKAAAKP